MVIWHGDQTELVELLAAVRAGCRDCGARIVTRTPCKRHTVHDVVQSFTQAELDWLLGMRRAPFWNGAEDRYRRKVEV